MKSSMENDFLAYQTHPTDTTDLSDIEIDKDLFNQAVLDHARFLGINPEEDHRYLYIAENALLAPLPEDWELKSTDGETETEQRVYYYNHRTGETSWENPTDELFRKMFEQQKLEDEQNAGQREEPIRFSTQLELEEDQSHPENIGLVNSNEEGKEWPIEYQLHLTPMTKKLSSDEQPIVTEFKEHFRRGGYESPRNETTSGSVIEYPDDQLASLMPQEDSVMRAIAGHRCSFVGVRGCIKTTEYLVSFVSRVQRWMPYYELVSEYSTQSLTLLSDYNAKNKVMVDVEKEKENYRYFRNLTATLLAGGCNGVAKESSTGTKICQTDVSAGAIDNLRQQSDEASSEVAQLEKQLGRLQAMNMETRLEGADRERVINGLKETISEVNSRLYSKDKEIVFLQAELRKALSGGRKSQAPVGCSSYQKQQGSSTIQKSSDSKPAVKAIHSDRKCPQDETRLTHPSLVNVNMRTVTHLANMLRSINSLFQVQAALESRIDLAVVNVSLEQQEKLQSYNIKLEDATSRLKQLQWENKRLLQDSARLGAMTSELAQLKTSLQTNETGFEKLRSQKQKLEHELDCVRFSMPQLEEKCVSAKDQASRYHQKLQELRTDYATVKGELSTMRNEKTLLEEQVEELQRELATVKKDLELDAAMLETRKTQFTRKASDCVSLEEEKKRLKEACELAQQKHEESVESLRKLQSTLKECASETESLRAVIQKKNSQLAEAETALLKQSSEKEHLEAALAELRSEMDADLSALERSKAELSQKLQQSQALEAVQESKIRSLQGNVRDTAAERDYVRERMQLSMEDYRSVLAQFALLKKEVEESRLQCRTMTTDKAGLEAERNQLKARIESLEAAKKTALDDLQETKARAQQLENNLLDLQKTIEARSETLSEEATEETHNREARESMLKTYEQKVGELEAALSLKKQEASALESHAKQVEDNLGRLQQEMKIALEARAKQVEVESQQAVDGLKAQHDLHIAKLSLQLHSFQDVLAEERAQKRVLRNTVLDLQGNIRVFCRIRPVQGSRSRKVLHTGATSDRVVVTYGGRDDGFSRRSAAQVYSDKPGATFRFDEVFDVQLEQKAVYKQVEPLIHRFLDGFSVTIFAYGQTGSGKTYTMEGDAASPGVIQQAAQTILEQKGEVNGSCSLTISMLEIYNEEIRDLFCRQSTRLEIKRTERGTYGVQNLTRKQIDLPTAMNDPHTLREVLSMMMNLLETGQRNRTVAKHQLNTHSSRSHLVVTFDLMSGNEVLNSLNFVDLAGSERLDRTGATGSTLVEAKHINKSLSALGNVIQALLKARHKDNFVPYRDSKLTFLLKDSLAIESGAKVLMMVCVSPEEADVDESVCSLQFATRCKSVKLGTASADTKQIRQLKVRLAQMKQELKRIRKGDPSA